MGNIDAALWGRISTFFEGGAILGGRNGNRVWTKMEFTAVFLLAALPLAAHHSTKGEFDSSTIVSMQGAVTGVRWLNPHGILFVDVTDASGKVTNWKIELPSPHALMSRGLKKDDLANGTRVLLDVWIAKRGGSLASMRSLSMPDGRTFSGATGWDDPLPTIFK